MTKQKDNILNEFVDFVREQGVVGLAVAVILGAAAKDVVDSLVVDIINPLIGVIFDAEVLGQQALTIGSGESALVLGWGNLVSKLVSLVIVAAVVYFALSKFMKKLDKQKNL